MQKDWSALRVTLLLYVIIAIFPFSFYFIHSSFDTLKKDGDVVQSLAYVDSGIQRYAIVYLTQHAQDQTVEKSVDRALVRFKDWMTDERIGQLLESMASFRDSFAAAETCWGDMKQSVNDNAAPEKIEFQSRMCLDAVRSVMLTADKVVQLQKSSMTNMLYIELASLMILIVLVIYSVRVYIHLQERKHAIHDRETGLFNQNYFEAELGKSCADSKRKKRHLSVLFVKMNNLASIQDAKQRAYLLKMLGGVVNASVRESDTAARYSHNVFALLLRETDESGADVLAQRLREAFAKQKAVQNEGLTIETVVFERKAMECQPYAAHLRQYAEAS